MGSLSYGALVARDYPMIMAVFTIGAVLTLIGILVSDILYSLIDPRIAFSKKS
jgi:peptide/nickel transport system permease protein